MTFGTETPDISTDDSLTIRPNNAAELGYAPAIAKSDPAGDSPFDQLLAQAKTVLTNLVYFPAKFRPGFVLEFDAVIDEAEMKRYRKAAQGAKKKIEDSDMSVGNAMILGEKCTGIFQVDADGQRQRIVDNEGDPLLLNSEAFLNAFGPKQNAHVAVRKFLTDADTNTIGAAVLREAGWGEDLQPLDPTEA